MRQNILTAIVCGHRLWRTPLNSATTLGAVRAGLRKGRHAPQGLLSQRPPRGTLLHGWCAGVEGRGDLLAEALMWLGEEAWAPQVRHFPPDLSSSYLLGGPITRHLCVCIFYVTTKHIQLAYEYLLDIHRVTPQVQLPYKALNSDWRALCGFRTGWKRRRCTGSAATRRWTWTRWALWRR